MQASHGDIVRVSSYKRDNPRFLLFLVVGLAIVAGSILYFLYFFEKGDDPNFPLYFLGFGVLLITTLMFQYFTRIVETMEVDAREIRLVDKKGNRKYGIAMSEIAYFFIREKTKRIKEGRPRYFLYAQVEKGPPWFVDSFQSRPGATEAVNRLHQITGKAFRDHADMDLSRPARAGSASTDSPFSERPARGSGTPALTARNSIARTLLQLFYHAASAGFLYLFYQFSESFVGDREPGLFDWFFRFMILVFALSLVRSWAAQIVRAGRLKLVVDADKLKVTMAFPFFLRFLQADTELPLKYIRSAAIYRDEGGDLNLGAVVEKEFKPRLNGGRILRLLLGDLRSLIPVAKYPEESLRIAKLYSTEELPIRAGDPRLEEMRAMSALLPGAS